MRRNTFNLPTRSAIDSDNGRAFTIDEGSAITLGTTVATTSGTSHDFPVPSWARRFTLLLAGVSLSGSAVLRIQLVDAGGVEITGYLGGSVRGGAGGDLTGGNSTAGADTVLTGAAGTVAHGRFVGELLNPATNTWVITHEIGQSDAARASAGGHSKSLSGVLTTVRLTTSNGTDTFDAGVANISYE